MEDFAPIIKNISRFIDLTDEEKEILVSHLRIVKVKKKQFIVQPDFVCQCRSYVLKGALQTYLVTNEGQEHVIALSVEDWWTSDFASYITQQPATLFVEAIEDSTLIQLSYKDEQELYEQVPKFERFFRLQVERSGVAIQKRMLWSISKTAEERYDELINRQPQFLQRFPQYVIASYLGMTTQFLSKIRNQKAKI
ncbi:Crp/Fnr family transcriptional regulator [Sphingobacterium sp. 18053]|uniref:Crp/Fnr family transcriptional regulator n=1 Tax=Sphingobacterium sp. 18053 TaxID=2681401 RepID=UPI00135713C2|nr:Crp/Fnr family transcriptional regulator [Sphingobacterium sp. 18053]